MTLRDRWEENAEDWLRWARTPGHDVYDRFHARRFLELLPPAGRLTVDVGAGEGRLGRDLVARGHRVAAVDASPTLARACRIHAAPLPAVLADAGALPLPNGCADLVVAFMSFQDVDELHPAMLEVARVLAAGGRFCMAIVHPVNSAGAFEGEEAAAPFVIRGSYLAPFLYHDDIERNGLHMSFHSAHRPLETYSRALEASGLVVEAIREVGADGPDDRWCRIPMFLHLLARRLG
jgi:SAM-dependent methyltransferase